MGGLLEAWDAQQERILPERLMHAKSRKFTRHWDGDGVGTKALNPKYIVEVERWSDDLAGMLRKSMERIADREARRAARDMDSSAMVKVMHAKGMLANPKGGTHLSRVFGNPAALTDQVKSIVDPMERLVREAAKRQSQKVIDAITELDAKGASAAEIQSKIRRMTGARGPWRKTLARYLTTAVIEGARAQVYGKAGGMLTKTWNTVGDEKVRHTHVAADGQERAMGSQFKVGVGWLAYPGDPAGPIGETINCRCWVEYDIDAKHADLFDTIAHLPLSEITPRKRPERKDIHGATGAVALPRGIGTVRHRNEDDEEEDES
jgi:hypothetical protein